MSNTTLTCCVCGKQFQRNKSEVKRNARLGREIFCSRSCSGTKSKVFDMYRHKPSKNGGYKCDEFSPYKKFMRIIKRRDEGTEKTKVGVTIQDLKDQWELQNGICPFTGWKLDNPPSHKGGPAIPQRASLDRIDSSKGYEKGNIQFVSLVSQYAKNCWSNDVIIEFAEAVMANKKVLTA